MDNLCDTCRGKDTCKTWLTRSPGSVIMDCTAYNLPPINHTEEVTRYCSDNAPRQCLNEKCAQAEVFKDKLFCTTTGKWWDLTPKTSEDIVNHPPHYNQGGLECIDVIAAMLGPEGTKDYCIGNVQKYIFRHKNKNGLEDLEKAQWYLNYRINMEEKTNETNEPK